MKIMHSITQNYFVRSNAVNYLCDKFPARLIHQLLGIYELNYEKGVRLPLIELAASSLHGQTCQQDDLLLFAERLIDDVLHQECDLVYSDIAVSFCRALLKMETDKHGEEEKMLDIDKKCYMVENYIQLEKETKKYNQSLKEDVCSQIEDIIKTLNQCCDVNSMDQCMIKECY